MAKAANEAEALEDFNAACRAGKLSGQFEHWTKRKANVLDKAMTHCIVEHGCGIDQVLDLGVGELSVFREWLPFTSSQVRYCGVDGAEETLKIGRRDFPDHTYVLMPFSELAANDYRLRREMQFSIPDIIVAFDILYHIPDRQVHDDLVAWVFDQLAEYVALTYPVDLSPVEMPRGTPGTDAFTRFPHPFPEVPDHWVEIHRETGRSPEQALVLYTRRA